MDKDKGHHGHEGDCVACRAEERLSNRNCNLVDNSVVMSLINQSMNRCAHTLTHMLQPVHTWLLWCHCCRVCPLQVLLEACLSEGDA